MTEGDARNVAVTGTQGGGSQWRVRPGGEAPGERYWEEAQEKTIANVGSHGF